MLKITLLLCALFAASVYADDRLKFESFKTQYGRSYGDRDEEVFAIFTANLRKSESLSNAPGNFAEYGVTQFMDLTPDEFASMYLMPPEKLSGNNADNQIDVNVVPSKRSTPPTYYDWTNEGVVTGVYNQQQCGDCWAFSITEAIESAWALAGNKLVSLSMQQVTSCDTSDDGCGGGDPPTAYEYVIKAGGLEPYSDYPFTSGDGITGYCKFDKADIVATIKNWAWVSRSAAGEAGMLTASYEYGPLSICVDASSWQTYRSGIITSNCGTRLDHCVQLTGWNTSSSNIEYWIVRNSWGVTWGNAGYIYIERNKNLCGIAQEATRPCVTTC